MSKMIFVNLPVGDLAASTAFYVALGGEVNPQFSGEQSTSLMFSDSIGVMLLTHDHYRQFTQRPIGDARRGSRSASTAATPWMRRCSGPLPRAAAPIPTQRRILASCSTATSRIPTAMSGRSCGWMPPRSPRRPRWRDRVI